MRGRRSRRLSRVIGTRLLISPSARLVRLDEALFRAGWRYLQQRSDKHYLLTD
jgi:hypothetical protein